MMRLSVCPHCIYKPLLQRELMATVLMVWWQVWHHAAYLSFGPDAAKDLLLFSWSVWTTGRHNETWTRCQGPLFFYRQENKSTENQGQRIGLALNVYPRFTPKVCLSFTVQDDVCEELDTRRLFSRSLVGEGKFFFTWLKSEFLRRVRSDISTGL